MTTDDQTQPMLTLYKNTQLLPWLVISGSLVFLLGYVLGHALAAAWRLALNVLALLLIAYALYMSWQAGHKLVQGHPDVYNASLGKDALQNNLYLTYILNIFLAVFLAYVVYSMLR